MSVVELLRTGVREQGMLAYGRPVVVMLSGGRDSTCLLDVAVEVCGADVVTALHVNYGLRESAGDDERYCVDLCRHLGVGLELKRARSRAPGNMQAWARELRYDAANQLALSLGAEIAAGHTSTDQVETILYRLASSPSRRALLGMRLREGNLVRPLLPFTREQTGEYCQERGFSWRDDESNDSGVYARGRIRNGLVPAFRQIHPGAEQNVLALAETLRDESEVLDGLVDMEIAAGGVVGLSRLRMLPPALARLIVQRLVDGVQERPTPGAARRLEDILALSDVGTSHVDLRGGVRATAVDGIVSFDRTPAIVREP
jgi:tRNA(Ile)-lysidine synthase